MNVMSRAIGGVALPFGTMDADVALLGVYEITKVLARPQSLVRALASVLGILSSFLDLRGGLITVLGEDGGLEPLVAAGGSHAAARHIHQHLPGALLAEIVATAMPVVVRDIAADPSWTQRPIATEVPEGAIASFVGVPIKGDGRVLGTLTVDRIRDRSAVPGFDEDLRVLTLVANLIGQNLRMHRLSEPRHDASPEPATAHSLDPHDGTIRRAQLKSIVGTSAALTSALDKAARVAGTQLTVLLRGESGTGKELFAHAIHDLSPRKEGPFVKVNCAALPETMLESELFGHEKGAFTGAFSSRKGRFELADGGTLFLDEIGDISSTFQAKLLRVLQEGEFERVGGARTLKVDVRIIAATNRDLETAVTTGQFRADLYYRLGVVPIRLPALRDRPSDIPLLARKILQRFNTENGTRFKLTSAALDLVKNCAFPGNVRELENCIRRTAALARGPEINEADFACRGEGCLASLLWQKHRTQTSDTKTPIGGITLPIAPRPRAAASDVQRPAVGDRGAPSSDDARTCCRMMDDDDPPLGCGPVRPCPGPGARAKLPERARLVEAMEVAGWAQAKAARLLDITPRQIGYALKKHGIEIKKL